MCEKVLWIKSLLIFSSRGVKLAALASHLCGPRDDSEITNEFRQYCNGSSSNKRLKPRSLATLERYKFLSFRDNFTDAGKVMTFFFLWRSILLRATLQRSLPREMVIFKSKTSCGSRHDCSYMQCGPQKLMSLTPLFSRKVGIRASLGPNPNFQSVPTLLNLQIKYM